MNVAPLLLQPVLYLWRPYSSQPSQHVCSLPADSGGHLRGNPQASHSALLQTVWKVCYKLRSIVFWGFFAMWYSNYIIGFPWETLTGTSSLVRLNVHLFSCRYLQPPATWMQCALESRELLALCLKKIKSSMTKVNVILTKLHKRQ